MPNPGSQTPATTDGAGLFEAGDAEPGVTDPGYNRWSRPL